MKFFRRDFMEGIRLGLPAFGMLKCRRDIWSTSIAIILKFLRFGLLILSVEIQFMVNIHSFQSPECIYDRFIISRRGRSDLSDAERYCGYD